MPCCVPERKIEILRVDTKGKRGREGERRAEREGERREERGERERENCSSCLYIRRGAGITPVGVHPTARPGRCATQENCAEKQVVN